MKLTITMANDGNQKLVNLPPSAKLVYYVISEKGLLTQKAIIDESLLPARTVRDALNRLEDMNAITKQIDLSDPRQRLYESDLDDRGDFQSGEVTADD